jgi:ribose transport system substrate-binding protein
VPRDESRVASSQRRKLPDKVLLPTEIIDKTNYKEWLVTVTDRPCPKRADVVR